MALTSLYGGVRLNIIKLINATVTLSFEKSDRFVLLEI